MKYLTKQGLLIMLTLLLASGLVAVQAEEKQALQAGTYKVLSEVQKDMEALDYREARRKLLALLKKDLPAYDQAVIYQTLGYAENGTGDFKAAAAAFEQALQLGTLPKKVQHEVLYSAAQLFIHIEQPEKGLKYLSRWFADEPNPKAEAHIVAASAYYQIEDYPQLIVHVEKAIAKSSKPQKSWYDLLLAAYFETKSYNKAGGLLETLVAGFPDNKDYWRQLAGVYQQLGKEKKALAVYELAYHKGLLQNDEVEQLVRSYLYLEMPYKAASVMEKELAIGGVRDNKDNLILLADSWLMAKENEKAESLFREVLTRFKDDRTRVRLGQLYVQMERWQDAVEVLDTGMQTDDRRMKAELNLLLGIALFNLDNKGKATSAFNRALSDKSTEDQARWWLDYLRKQAENGKAG